MTAMRTSRSASEADQISGHNVLVNAGSGLVVLPRRRRDEMLARLHADSLDARLAAGEPAENERLLAVRAAQITSPAARERLAGNWDDVLARSRRVLLPSDPRVPVALPQVDAAEREIELVAGTLRARRPVSARGVALVTALLTAPTGPLYRRRADGGELAAALYRAAGEM